jgi:hypothetical protein
LINSLAEHCYGKAASLPAGINAGKTIFNLTLQLMSINVFDYTYYYASNKQKCKISPKKIEFLQIIKEYFVIAQGQN